MKEPYGLDHVAVSVANYFALEGRRQLVEEPFLVLERDLVGVVVCEEFSNSKLDGQGHVNLPREVSERTYLLLEDCALGVHASYHGRQVADCEREKDTAEVHPEDAENELAVGAHSDIAVADCGDRLKAPVHGCQVQIAVALILDAAHDNPRVGVHVAHLRREEPEAGHQVNNEEHACDDLDHADHARAHLERVKYFQKHVITLQDGDHFRQPKDPKEPVETRHP